jgi:hypothetical protein
METGFEIESVTNVNVWTRGIIENMRIFMEQYLIKFP